MKIKNTFRIPHSAFRIGALALALALSLSANAQEADVFGGISTVDMEEVMDKNYIPYSLSDMQGDVGGWYGSSLWAQDSYLVLVDGVPRDAGNVKPSEIESVTFLKSAASVVIYGSRAAKGAILITTKRGKTDENWIKARGNTGFYVPIAYPKYLGSAEYMTLYNEARVNDGLEASYTDDQIYNYAAGTNSYRYPNLNLYSSDYLKRAYNESDATVEISGGGEKARYYTNVNFYNIGSLLKFGNAQNDHTTRLSVRGNVDMEVSKYVSTWANAAASFYDSHNASGDFWGATSSLRPNRVSPLVPISSIKSGDEDLATMVANSSNIVTIDGEQYLLGGTQLDQTNALADLCASGTSTYTSRQYQFDMGVKYDMGAIVKGLSFKTMFAIDYNTSYSKYYSNSYATYAASWSGEQIIGLTKYGEDSKSGVENVSGSYSAQTIQFSAQFDYARSFAEKHNISATLMALGYQQSYTGVYHRTSNANLSLQVDYNYNNRYFVRTGEALIHSAKLPAGNRKALSPSLSLGWKIFNESDNMGIIDSWSLNASGAIVNTDLDISDYYMYDGIWTYSDGAWIGWADSNLAHAFESRRGENLDMTYIKRKELTFGTKLSMLNHGLELEFNYFTTQNNGLLTQATTIYPSYFTTGWPTSSFIPYVNYNNYSRKGFEFTVNAKQDFGALKAQLGVTGTYYVTKNSRLDETYENDYQYCEGKPIDGVWGLQCLGFFNSDEEAESWASSEYGETQAGDLKYVDQNNDGVINSEDVVYLGKRWGYYGAPFTLGVNLTLKYDRFTLFALATGYFGGWGLKSSDYYWVYGDRKYSEVVLGRWTADTAESATYPRLTTQSNTHNFQTSDFWLYSTSRLNVGKLQLSYNFDTERWGHKWHNVLKDLDVYVYGSNLLTIAKERKVLELSTASSPQCRYLGAGAKFTF